MNLTKRVLFFFLAISIVISDLIIIFAEVQTKAFYSSSIIIINALAATVLAAAIVYKQKGNFNHEKRHIAITVGLALWVCADISWAIYELVLHIAPPIPSIADIFWLAGYGFLVYNLYITYQKIRSRFTHKVLMISASANAALLAYLILLTIDLSNLTTGKGITMFAVTISYPILNAILVIPAITILAGLRHDHIHSIPWVCESLSLLCISISDSWFAFIFLTHLVEQLWLASLFFAAEYLVMAAGLLWYLKFATSGHASGQTDRTGQATNLQYSKVNYSIKAISKQNSRDNKTLTSVALSSVAIVILLVLILGTNIMPLSLFFDQTSTTYVIPSAAAFSKQTSVIRLGALVPISGIASSLGVSEFAAIQIAVDDINQNFSKAGSNIRVELVAEDTKSDPVASLQGFKDLDQKGVKIIIGPATSAVAQSLLPFANKDGILLISPSSTAPSLAIAKDNLFRFAPDDSHQGEAVAHKIWNDGVRVIVPIWRGDIYGDDLTKSTKENFEKLGGKVTDGIRYDPPTGDMSASLNRINFMIWDQSLKMLSSQVSTAIDKYGSDKVGVYVVAFDEVVPIFIQAQNHQALDQVRWYGSDGSAKIDGIVKNPDARKFAQLTGFANPSYQVPKSEMLDNLEKRIKEKIKEDPREYSATTYDALWVAFLTEKATNQTKDINNLKSTFAQVASNYDGLTGRVLLNDAGDRENGSYGFWSVQKVDGDQYQWQETATYP